MPKDTPLTKQGKWALRLIHGFFGSLHKRQLADFLKSEELERFLHDAATGSFGGKVPSGKPGSEFPSTTGRTPLEALRGLLHGLGSGLGEIDRPGGADPASGAEPEPDRVHIVTGPSGNIHTTISHPDGSTEEFIFYADGSTLSQTIDSHGRTDFTRITPGAAGGCTVETGTLSRDGPAPPSTITHYGRDGRPLSPGEDGGGANTGRSPLDNVDVLGPQSMKRTLTALEHPDDNSEKLDQNTGLSGHKFTDADRERLGRIVPAAEVLDPNSGLDPLSALNLDPNQHTSSKDDDRLDPNTGLKPVPGKG